MGKYYEEFVLGEKYKTTRRSITETDIMNFIGISGMIEPLFLDLEHVMKESVFKKRISPGALVFSIAEGLVLQTGFIYDTAVAFLGVSDWKINMPVVVGDTLYVEFEVIDKRPTRHADRGILVTKNLVKNQRHEIVTEYTPARMLKKNIPG